MLEMGEPVAIVDLAHGDDPPVRLSPSSDIAIEVVGARPGEKLHEELFNPYERPQPTPAEKILRAERARLDPDWVEATFAEINLFVLEGDAAALAAKVASCRPCGTAAAPGARRSGRPGTLVGRVASPPALPWP